MAKSFPSATISYGNTELVSLYGKDAVTLYTKGKEEEIGVATITYNGSSTTVKIGETATLPCAGKKAKSDIIIEFYSTGTIDYNDTETVVEAGKVATLPCAGKKMLTDVVVAVNTGE